MKTTNDTPDLRNSEPQDNTIRRTMSQLPAGPSNPWLPRKVMNRLPDTGSHRHSRVVNIAYAISCVILIAAWIYAATTMFSGDAITITYRDIIYIGALSVITTLIPVSYRTA